MVESLVDVTERLMAEFDGAVQVDDVARVVRASRENLAGSPPGAMPELVERLARQRLRDRS